MKVLMVEPGKSPYETEIEGGLESLQAAVGGDIQATYPYEDPVALICNDEGKLIGMPLNRALYDDGGRMYDIVAGEPRALVRTVTGEGKLKMTMYMSPKVFVHNDDSFSLPN